MVVLIVDDQTNVVSGIISGVDWEKVGVTKVLKAYNAYEAKEIFNSQIVDIMLCDIEMPVENGLSLFRWVKNQDKGTECIFLTAHADFIYAKEAVQLGSFDFIVQPARYEDIQDALLRAAAKVKSKKDYQEYYSYGKMLYRKKGVLLDSLLKDWFMGRPLELDMLLEDFKKLHINIDGTSELYLVLLNIMRWQTQIDEWDENLLKNTFLNIISELFMRYGQKILFVQLDSKNFAFVTYTEENASMDEQAVSRQLDFFIQFCRKHIKCSIACYTGAKLYPGDLAVRADQLLQMRDDNVGLSSRVFLWGTELGQKRDGFHVPSMKRWANLLAKGFAQIVREEAYSYLDELSSSGKLDAEALKRFYQDFMQMLFNVTGQLDISANEIFINKEILEKSLNSYATTDQMKSLIEYVTHYFETSSPHEEVTKSQINRIIDYIHNNIEKDIRRSDIAELVFLNPDYISRLFKKDVGMSLKDFILTEKMKVAQTLLKTTVLPVGMVAAKVGYDNFSHFSQVYKKVMGITPAEDRKNSL